MIDLRGWARTSLIDFPEHIATVLFTGGCDFRCPMCHNADLVLRPGSLPSIDPSGVLDFLSTDPERSPAWFLPVASLCFSGTWCRSYLTSRREGST